MEVDESEAQTKKVLKKLAQLHGLNRADTDPELFRPWQDFQRSLALGETRVQVPYAEVLAEMFGSYRHPRLRRDFDQLLSAIKAHALLHRKHCRRAEDGSLLADISNDYAAVRPLMAEFMASAAEVRLRKRIRETVEVVRELTSGPRTANASVRLVAGKLRVDEQTARRHLHEAEEAGYLINTEERKNRPALYQLTPQPPDDPDYELLPTVKELRREWKRRSNRAEPQSEKKTPKAGKSAD